MSAEVATPATASTESGTIFDDEWSSFGGDDLNDFNLDHIDLDALLAPSSVGDTVKVENGDSIDPQALSKQSTPQKQRRSVQDGDDEDNIFVASTLGPEDFDRPSTASPPDFHPSFENAFHQAFADQPGYIQSSLGNQLHHRSVSEPPVDIPSAYSHSHAMRMTPEPPMTFTRSGIKLGTPKQHHGNRATRQRHPHIQEPYPVHRPYAQERYHPRRAHTQTLRPGPTSVPPMMGRLYHPPPAPMMVMQQSLPQPPMVQAHVGGPTVTSRVCTPAPSPSQVDPCLIGSPRPVSMTKAVTLPVSLEDLRGMISEAVEAAISSAGIRSSIEVGEVAEVGGDGNVEQI